MSILELIWICLTFLLPVPGCPTGYLGPGGLHKNSKYWNCSGGSAAHIDKVFFGIAHMYQSAAGKAVYQIEEYYQGINDSFVTPIIT